MTVIASQFIPERNLRGRVKAYKRRMSEIEQFLTARPGEWGRFQSEFNQEINGIFRDLMIFEKESLLRGEEGRIYKLKNFFIRRFRKDFVRGEYLKWSLEKPYGYAGDFKIIDSIYDNGPKSNGFERLYDNYFQMSSICIAVRNRKEDFKKIVLEAVDGAKRTPLKIMNLASGPCRDVSEVLQSGRVHGDVVFHCYDNDMRAIDSARDLLKRDPRVVFFKQNAIRIALMKEAEKRIHERFDIIYSTGLFDYLDEAVSLRLIANLRRLLKQGGMIAISDVRDKFSNPSIYFMEWVADWNLVYRDDDCFRTIFVKAGFEEKELTYLYEQQGVLQYVLARRLH